MKSAGPRRKASNDDVPSRSLSNRDGSDHPGAARLELTILAVVLLVGIALRLLAVSKSAVEHFDEGVYASNLYFGPPDYAYPQQRFYAPPLLPALIETGMIAGLPPNLAALLPALLAGCATIAALWWLGRTWFGPRVGLAAATLCALSDFHIAYSAAALTDVLLGLWLVLAVQAIGLSLWKGDLRWAIAAGLFTALAWWTKYNGWLPLAIEATAIGLISCRAATSGRTAGKAATSSRRSGSAGASPSHVPPSHVPPSRLLICLAGAALTAIGLWVPYLWSLQTSGGYGPIAANHARYVVGLAGWPDALARQIAAQHVLEGWPSPLGVGLAVIVVAGSAASWAKSWKAVAWAVVAVGLALLAALGSMFVLITAAAAIGLAAGWLRTRSLEMQSGEARRTLVGLALLTAWWCGLALATPCYWPYPRLLVPWLLASWLAAALCLDEFFTRRCQASAAPGTLRGAAITGMLLVAAAIGGWALRPASGNAFSASDRRGFVRAGEQIQDSLGMVPPQTGQPPHAVFYVYGEPALLFQLRAAGEQVVIPIQTIPIQQASEGGRPLPTYLLLGPHALADPNFQRDWPAHRANYELVGSYPIALSTIVTLDLFDPRQPLTATEQVQQRAELHRLREIPGASR